jgi:predicted nucleic acid-binding protein
VITITDTGPLVAVVNPRDTYHLWAVETLKTLSGPLITCEAVLAEAAHLTGAPQRIAEMVADGSLQIRFRLDEQAQAVAALLGRYGSRMDLADACIVRMSELNPHSRVFTLDRRDFSVYRRNGRGLIPLLAPEE